MTKKPFGGALRIFTHDTCAENQAIGALGEIWQQSGDVGLNRHLKKKKSTYFISSVVSLL